MKFVSNTGPIIALAKAGYLSILKEIASEVLIPPMVHRELLGKPGNETVTIENAMNEFIHTANLKPLEKEVEITLAHLDEGEKQAIGLAFTLGKEALLLLDDQAGRRVARRLNIPTMGLVGILLTAKRKNLIGNVGQVLEEIRNTGYWLSDDVIDIARGLAGEKENEKFFES